MAMFRRLAAVALAALLAVSCPAVGGDAEASFISAQSVAALDAAVAEHDPRVNGKTASKVTAQGPPPPKGTGKVPPPPKGSGKGSPPKSGKPVKIGPPPPRPPPPPTVAAARWANLVSNLSRFGVFSKYLKIAKGVQFDQVMAGMNGWSLTLFVAPDSVYKQLKSSQARILLQLLKFNTIYGYYTYQNLTNLKPGAAIISTNYQLPVYKLKKGNQFNGRAILKSGAAILAADIYVDKRPSGGNWIVQKVSSIMNPPQFK